MAFTARNARIVAISVDKPEVSRKFAKEYKLYFPLIEDKNLTLARKYVGVDVNGYSLPGVVVVAPDQTIALRRVGTTPGDRIYAAELLGIVDGLARKYDITSTGPAVAGGYAPLERINLRVGIGLGLAQERAAENEFGFAVDGSVAGFYPLARYVMLGALARGITGSSTRVDLAGALRVRFPGLDDNAEIYAQIPFGVTFDVVRDDADDHERTGWNSGLAFGLQFAPKPSLAIFLELEGLYHRFAGLGVLEQRTELRYQLGGGLGFLF